MSLSFFPSENSASKKLFFAAHWSISEMNNTEWYHGECFVVNVLKLYTKCRDFLSSMKVSGVDIVCWNVHVASEIFLSLWAFSSHTFQRTASQCSLLLVSKRFFYNAIDTNSHVCEREFGVYGYKERWYLMVLWP